MAIRETLDFDLELEEITIYMEFYDNDYILTTVNTKWRLWILNNIFSYISETKMEQRTIYVSDITQDVGLDNISEGHWNLSTTLHI